MDVFHIKIAVDFQNLSDGDVEGSLVRCLDSLRTAAGVDAAFIALLDDAKTMDERKFDVVHSAVAEGARAEPKKLEGLSLAELPWLASRLQHMRTFDILDTQYYDDTMGTD